MFTTPILNLTNKNDFTQIVEALFALRDLTPYERGLHPLFHLDPSRHILLPTAADLTPAWWEFVNILCLRTAIRGRKTIVALIKPVINPDIPLEKLSINDNDQDMGDKEDAINEAVVLQGLRRSARIQAKTSQIHSDFSPLASRPPLAPHFNTNIRPDKSALGADSLPDPSIWSKTMSEIPSHFSCDPPHFGKPWCETPPSLMVVKSSYCLESDSDNQIKVFDSVQGQHGIPRMLTGIKMKHGLGILKDLPIEPCRDLHGVYSGDPLHVEDRVEVFSACLDVGVGLDEGDLTLKEWLKSILDGMIGMLVDDEAKVYSHVRLRVHSHFPCGLPSKGCVNWEHLTTP